MSGGVITPSASGGNSISFAEIVKGRDSTVRVTVDGLIYAVDLVMVMTGKNCNHSNEVLRDLIPSLFNNEKFVIRSRSKLVSFQRAIELVMVLPGQVAKETRTQFANVIRRYMAGDATLVDEIEANAQSDSPLAQMARASLLPTHFEVDDEHTRKRKALELAEKEEALEMSRLDRQAKTLKVQKDLMDMYAMVSPDNQLDDRTRLHFKDVIINLSNEAAGNYKAITDGSSKSPNASLTISTVATELGLRFSADELKSVGAKISKLYLAKYGKRAYQHEQSVGGAVCLVRSYTERDRAMIEGALREFKTISK